MVGDKYVSRAATVEGSAHHPLSSVVHDQSLRRIYTTSKTYYIIMDFNKSHAIRVGNGTSRVGWESRDLLWPAFASLNATVAIVGLLGNLLVVGSYVSSHRLASTASNVLVVALACIDLVTCILVIPPAVWAQLEGFWPLPSWACDLHCVLNYTTIIASMATIAVISIERQLAVTSPAFHHSRVTKKILLKIEIVILASAMLIASVPSGFQWVKYDKWEGVCTIDWFTYQAALIYVISAFLGCFTIPSLLTLLANLKIIRVSYRTSKRKGPRVNIHPEIIDTLTDNVTENGSQKNGECDKNFSDSSNTGSALQAGEISARASCQAIQTRNKSSGILAKPKRTTATPGRSELHRIIVRSMSICHDPLWL